MIRAVEEFFNPIILEISSVEAPSGCTPKPKRLEKERLNDWALGYDKEKHTMTCMPKRTRAVYSVCESGVSGVTYNKKRKRREAYIAFQQVDRYLGSCKTKKDAIEARTEGEKKYFDPYVSKERNKNE